MNAYTIEVTLKIKQQVKSTYSTSDETFAQSEVTKRITCWARDVRHHTTKVVRQAVDAMSESAQTALAEAIKTEVIPVESQAEPAALEV